MASDELEYEGRFRALGEWGLLVNLTRHDALGATFFLSVDRTSSQGAQFRSGPAVRYRRWISPRSALEVAVGHRSAAGLDLGATFGMVKYSPTPAIGFAVRGEAASRTCPTYLFSDHQCITGWVSSRRLLAGVELGGKPGLWVGVVCAVVGAIAYEVSRSIHII